MAQRKPDMYWDADEPEDGTTGDGPQDFASNYAENCLGLGESEIVTVLCANRAHTRKMRITVAAADDADTPVTWEWVEEPLDNMQHLSDERLLELWQQSGKSAGIQAEQLRAFARAVLNSADALE